MVTAYLALGSNLDDPHAQLLWAIEELKNLPKSHLGKVSSFRFTTPVGYTDQPDILNAVVELQTDLSPRELLTATQALESARKRMRLIKNGPRTLDIDILLYGDSQINEPDLVIPHPRMWQREFVLVPLFEIAGHLSAKALINAD